MLGQSWFCSNVWMSERSERRHRGPTERLPDVEPPKPTRTGPGRETVELTPELMALAMSWRPDQRPAEARTEERARGPNPWKLLSLVMLAVVLVLSVMVAMA